MQPQDFERLAAKEVPKLLQEYLGSATRTKFEPALNPKVDLQIASGEREFHVELKSSGSPGPVEKAISQLKTAPCSAGRGSERIPLVVVPFMGPTGARLCEDAGISWLDLSGNASIRGKGLRIYVTGNPNRFKRPGPSSQLFSTKSSRVLRQLLMEPNRTYRQKDLVQLTGLPQGYVSMIVRQLVHDDYLRADGHALTVHRPNLLLAEWREKYDFSKHRILTGHKASRSGESLLHEVSSALRKKGVDYMATGLAGAWLLTHFTGFRLVTLFLHDWLDEASLEQLGIRTDSSAPNLWFALPRDEAVFAGGEERERIPCAHPVQVYLDLKAQPERALEAAQQVKDQFLEGDDRQ